MHNEAYPLLQILRLLRLEAKFLDDLVVIIWESALEDLVDVRLAVLAVFRAHFRIKALLNHVAGKLQLTQSDEVFGNLLEDSLILISVFKFDHVLYQIVSIGVLNEFADVLNDVVGQFQLLGSRTFLKAPLHNATTVFMLSDWDTVVNASFEDEVGVLAHLVASEVVFILRSFRGLEDHQEGLDDVIAMHVDSEVNYLQIQASDDLLQNVVVGRMDWSEFESLHLFKRNFLVLGSLDDLKLILDSVKYSF